MDESQSSITSSNTTDNKQLTAEEILHNRMVKEPDGFHDEESYEDQMSMGYKEQIIEAMEQYAKKYSAQQNAELIKEVEELKKVISEWEQFCKAVNESISEKVEYIDELIKELEKLKKK